MSGWPGKYVIGLTGNIATGKSVVRKMLENLGAYGIDADSLALVLALSEALSLVDGLIEGEADSDAD